MQYQFPKWSYDGRFVFFKSNSGGTRDIWWFAVNEQGRPTSQPQTLTIGANAYDLTLSADGRKLVYMKGGYEFNIYSIPIKSEQINRIEDANQITFEKQQINSIDVAPNQKQIAYSSIKSGGKEWEIWKADMNGENKNRIYKGKFNLGHVKWSPNNDQLVFHSFKNGHNDIYTISINTGQPIPIVSDPANDIFPSWSPSGNEIIFCSDREGDFDLWIVSLPNGNLRRLTDKNADEVRPSWSPDGKSVVYLSNETKNWEIYINSANGEGEPKKLTDLKFGEPKLQVREMMFPIWSLNSEVIYTTYIPGGDDQSRKIIAISVSDGTFKYVYDIKGGNLQWESSPSIAIDKNNLYFIPKYLLGDIHLLNLEY